MINNWLEHNEQVSSYSFRSIYVREKAKPDNDTIEYLQEQIITSYRNLGFYKFHLENSSEEELFSILKSVLTGNLEIARMALFTSKSSAWSISMIEGIEVEECEQIEIPNLIQKFPDIGIINQDSGSTSLHQFDIAIPVFHHKKPLAFMLLADVEGEKMEISPIIKHLRFIQTLINIIVVALENKRLNEQEVREAAIIREMELARNMQTLLFPKTLPNTNLLKVKSIYLPHNEVGGDYYDVIPLSNNRTALCIADVSGKGISAALLMANFQANLRALVGTASTLEELIKLCNQRIIDSADYQKFITLFIAIFDPNKMELTYVNCGHQPPILIQGNDRKFLRTGSTVLGMFDELPSITVSTIPIYSGNTFVCYTDGLTEITNPTGEQLEAEGIDNIILEANGLTEIVSALKSTIRKNDEENGLDDDITLLAAQFL